MMSHASNEPRWKIGEASRRSGVGAANIRYYEREGLLAPQARADNDYRLYSEDDVHRLRFIRLCRAMDMSLEEVRSLLSLDLGRKADCVRAREVLDAHLAHVRERLAELRPARVALALSIQCCTAPVRSFWLNEQLSSLNSALLSRRSSRLFSTSA